MSCAVFWGMRSTVEPTPLAPLDPATQDPDLRICALDYEITMMSEVIETPQKQTPGIRQQFRGFGQAVATTAQKRDEADTWLEVFLW